MSSFRRPFTSICIAAIICGLAAATATAQRVVPAEGEVLKVDQVIILVDVTGSTGVDGVFELEKQLVNDFVSMMPDMTYQAGFTTFAGVDEHEWTHVGLRNGTLPAITKAAAGYEYLGRSTPLLEAVEGTGCEFRSQAGSAALVVFSDGKAKPKKHILNACADLMEAQNGQLCIYTVNVGSSEEGKMLLQDMADISGCGQAWQAADLSSREAMEAMVRTVFFGQASRTVVLGAEVLFDFDQATLKPEGKQAIDALIADMNANSNERVTVEGHTCDLGSDSYNMGLSQRRADAVKAYMVDEGISASRITTQGYGETRPAVPNTSSSNRSLNRRAEFKFSTMR